MGRYGSWLRGSVGWAVAGWGSPPAQAGEIYILCRYPWTNTARLVLKLKPLCWDISETMHTNYGRVGTYGVSLYQVIPVMGVL